MRARFPLLWRAIVLAVVAFTLAVAGRAVAAEPKALAGDGQQHLDLPLRAFTDLREATVEGWIRFDVLGRYSRFYDVGRTFHSVNVTHYERSPNLMFECWVSENVRAGLHVTGLLRTNEWAHIATVCGPSGMRLYFNGVLIATNAFRGGFSLLHDGGSARLLGGNWDPQNEQLEGAIGQVRLWRGVRSDEEIAAGLFQRVSAAETNLVGAWPLESDLQDVVKRRAARPSAPPRFTALDLPPPAELPHPAIITGQLRTASGQPVNLAHVRLRGRDGRMLAAGRTGTDGSPSTADINGAGVFRLAVYATNEMLRLEATHPSGRAFLPPFMVTAGEIRTVALNLPSRPSSTESTNHFVRMLMADLGMGEPWLREMAANDLSALGPFPQAAAALAGSLPFEQDALVRERITLSLHALADHSTVAIAALLEDTGPMPRHRVEELQRLIRKRPIPGVLQPVYTRRTLAVALLFAGVFGSFALLHFFFFLCERLNFTHGIYALFTGTGAAGTLANEWARGSTEAWKSYLGPALLALAYLCGLRMVYSVFTHSVPRRFWVLGALFAAVGVRLLLGPRETALPLWLQFLVLFIAFAVVIEMMRVAWDAYRARKPGSRLIGGGIVFFFLCQFLAPLQAPIVFDDVRSAWLFPLGMSAFVASASMHLARQFVRTNRALREANVAIARNQAQLHHEVAEAEAYLRSLFPPRWDGPPVTTSWVFQPSTQLGGDAFGYHWIDSDRLAIYLIDACGHGVGAALLAVSALNAIRSPQLNGPNFADPVAVLAELNHAFPMEAHHNQYFSAWYGIYDRTDRTLRYSSAGHPPAYLMTNGERPLRLRTPGAPIGCRPEPRFSSEQVTIPPGAAVMIISDGVYEVAKPGGRPCTLREFEAGLDKFRWPTPEHVLAWAREANGRRPLEDDFSVVRLNFL